MPRIKLKNVTIDYDENYGMDKNTGWSIAIDGHYYVQFHHDLKEAVLIAAIRHTESELHDRSGG
jgi:plasmid stabilization system protein ParE